MKATLKLSALVLALAAFAPAAHALPRMMAANWTLEAPNTAGSIPPGMTTSPLVNISNDRDATIQVLGLLLGGDEKITGMFSADSKSPKDGKAFLLSVIEGKEGAVLYEASGRKAIILSGKLDRATQQGRFTLKYLANGLSMRYESCDFVLDRSGSNWLVKNAYTGGLVREARITSWSMGITTIEGICPKK